MYRSDTTRSLKPNRRNFPVCNSHKQRSHVTMAIPDTEFSAVRFCSYTVSVQYGTTGLAFLATATLLLEIPVVNVEKNSLN